MKKLLGFTLAEVLITIGVIGAISVMVLPNIRLAYSKKLFLTQLEKTYSTLANTIKMSEYHNGKVKRWQFTKTNASGSTVPVPAKDIFDKYFKGYMKYALEMPSSELGLEAEDRKYINGNSISAGDYVKKTYKKDAPENEQGYHVIMMDGTMVSFWTVGILGGSGGTVIVMIDTNGESSPNTLGKDTFMFSLSNNAGLIPMGECANGKGPQSSRVCSSGKNPPTNVKRKAYNGTGELSGNGSCNRNNRGYWCAALIMLDGWHISKDYPWDKH